MKSWMAWVEISYYMDMNFDTYKYQKEQIALKSIL